MTTIYGFGKTETQLFYSNKIIFITGGTGFVGSALIEKLIRTCPDIKKFFLLIRNKKGKSAEERLQDLYEGDYWQKLKFVHPNFKEKLQLICGDLIDQKLVLSESDKNLIINEVQIVYHLAATVRFDENLKKAAYMNIRATKYMMELCCQIKNLESVVHVSTAYSQCVLPELKEKFYPQVRDPEEFLEFCDNYTEEQLHEMTPSIIKDYPNTYTFTKGLAENLIQKYSNDIPITIVRPSIIMGCWREPIPGWVNSILGPVGLLLGMGIGIIHVMYVNDKCVTDIVPVDMVVNCIITAGVQSSKRNYRKQEIQIYNLTSSKQNPLTWKSFILWLRFFGPIYATVQTKWIYFVVTTNNEFRYKLYRNLLHTFPAKILDTVRTLRGKKPMLVKLYDKIHRSIDLIKYFGTREWLFHDDNTKKLYNNLSNQDQMLFNFNIKDLEWDEFLYHTVRGMRAYLVKDPMSTIPEAHRKFKILTVAHYTIMFIILAIFASILYFFYTLIF